MGCTGSKATAVVKKPETPEQTFEEYAAERRKKLEEEEKKRVEEEKEISEKLYAEKEGLRIKSHFMIEQNSSCDNLLELLEKADLDHIRADETSLLIQKSAKLKVEMTRPDRIKRSWIIYNNFGAIPREDMELVADFFSKILALTSFTADASTGNGSEVALHKFSSPETWSKETIKNRKSMLLALNISTLVTEHSFKITDENVHCYDLPSGLITAGVAKAVFELYQQRGRLSETAVHKLLKLGYKSLKSLPNVSSVEVGPDDRLIVVGDIHGQLQDLIYIIESSGMPSKTNKYIFNGDFVDRGEHGAEVVCLLLAMHLAFPESVMLNRGNHEDYAICVNYGFQMECIDKYDELTFGMFVEVFQQLPLCTIINSSVLVIHGGLFHCKNPTLEELNRIHRTGFTLQDLPEDGESIEAVARENEDDFLKQLQRDALWSDPIDATGNHMSPRGAGVGFGPDVTRAFLELNKLRMVVRSHECVNSGYQEPYSGENAGMLCTIFSASDYSGGGNTAAYMVFRLCSEEERTGPNAVAVGMEKSYSERAAERVAAISAEASVTDTGEKSPTPVDADEEEPAVVIAEATEPGTGSTDNEKDTSATEQGEASVAAGEAKPPASPTSPASPTKSDADLEMVKDPEQEIKVIRGSNLAYSVRYYYMNPADSGGMRYENLLAPKPHDPAVAAIERKDSSDTLVPDEVEYPEEAERVEMGAEVDATLVKRENLLTAEQSTENMLKAKARGVVLFGATMTLFELIVRRKVELSHAFENQDPSKTGGVTQHEWSTVMSTVLQLYLRWHEIIHILVDESHYKESDPDSPAMIDYEKFLESFTPDVCVIPTSVVIASRTASFNYGANKSRENSFTATDIGVSPERLQEILRENENQKQMYKTENPNSVSLAAVEAIANEETVTFNEYSIPECVAHILYSENFEKIVAGFRSIDTTNRGYITKEQFAEGCARWNMRILEAAEELKKNDAKTSDHAAAQEILNNESASSSPPAALSAKRRRSSAANVKQIEQIDRLMLIMDVNEAGKIDINEFFEMFRLSIGVSLAYHGGDEEAYWMQFAADAMNAEGGESVSSPFSEKFRGRSLSGNRERTTSLKRSGSSYLEPLDIHGVSIHIDKETPPGTRANSVEEGKFNIDMLKD